MLAKQIVCLGSLLAGVVVTQGAALYTYENDGRTYVVTVPTNTTEEISAEAVQILNDVSQTVTNFVKRGDGTLTVSSDLAQFTGDLCVEAGEYQMIPPTATNYAMGRDSVDSVAYVREGATLSLNVARAITSAKHTVCFEGTGFGGIGAILVRKAHTQPTKNIIGSKWVLSGDALVVNKSTNLQGLLVDNAKIDMQGHTLTYGGDKAYIKFVDDADLRERMGDIVFASGSHQLATSLTWLKGGHTMRVKKDVTLVLNQVDKNSAASTYTNVFEKGCLGINVWNNSGDVSQYHNYFAGPTVIEGDFLPLVKKDGTMVQVWFNGPISGGGFTLGSGMTLGIGGTFDWQHPYRNTFTNGIVAAAGSQVRLNFGMADWDSVPRNGGPIVLTNATLWTKNGMTYFLPRIVMQGACEVIGRHDFDYNCVPNGKGGFTEKGTAESAFRNERTLEFGANADVAFSADVVASNVKGLAVLTNATTVADSRTTGVGVGLFMEKIRIGYTWEIDTAQVTAGQRMLVRDQIDLCDGIQVRLTGAAKAKGGVRSFKIAEAGTSINWLGAKTLTATDDPKHWKLRIGEDGRTLWADYTPDGLILIFR